MIAINPKKSRRRHRRSRRSNPMTYSYNRRRRHRSHNPSGAVSIRRPLGALTAGFKPSTLANAGVVAAGGFAGYWLRNQITTRLAPTWSTGPGSYAIGLGSAGALLLVPKVGAKLFSGAVLVEVMRALGQYVLPNVKLLGEYLTAGEGGVAGMDEYLNTQTAMQGMNDYLEEGEASGVEGAAASFD